MAKKYTWMALIAGVILLLGISGCAAIEEIAAEPEQQEEAAESEQNAVASYPEREDITINDTLTNDEDGGHAVSVSAETASYSNVAVVKTGEASGDEADFYGENSAVFATDGATLDLQELIIDTDGTHANAVFSYGSGTTVTIADSVIETKGNCSGGLMTTGGGTMIASDLNIHTYGNSSAAIRSDRGGGIVQVSGGRYVTEGVGSPVIYSTADITVSDAELVSTASEGVVVEGKNSVALNNVELIADNNKKNSDKSSCYNAVMIYQSMSGDAEAGQASFTMKGGKMTNVNGDVFFVNNTVATIELTGAAITNQDAAGLFLRAAAAGWGNAGSNGGHVTMTGADQVIDGDMLVDEVSTLNLYLTDGSSFTGAINSDGAAGQVYVELSGDSRWTLTGDSYIDSLTCAADSIDLNGHTLYVNGTAYTAGTVSSGEAIEVEISSSSGGPSGTPPEAPPGGFDGGTPPEAPPGGFDGGTPPEAPPGGFDGEEPPAKP